MRTPSQPHLLVIGLVPCLPYLIIFKALLLNAQLADADDGSLPSCYEEARSPLTCPLFQKNITIFPFLTSPVCGPQSSFTLSKCNERKQKPIWPSFKILAMPGNSTLEPPYVVGLSQTSRFVNSSNQSSSSKNQNISDATQTVGSINLTWIDTPINQSVCRMRASQKNISAYLPKSIDLTSFAHASFQFSSSNIFLLFNCSNTATFSGFSLEKNSTACRSYERDCKPPKKESQNCYQYASQGMRELNVSVAMERLDCEYAMFFVVRHPSIINASQWSAGLIELSWSTSSNRWMDANLKSCEGCLQSNGTCGYDSKDDFSCYCANDTEFATNCTVADNRLNQTAKSSPAINNNGSAKIILAGVATLVIAITLIIIGGVALNERKRERRFTTKSLPLRQGAKQVTRKNRSLFIKHLDLNGLTERPTEYQYASIALATKEFSDLLGEGGFGAVYKGIFSYGKGGDTSVQIAVKVLETRSKHSKKQFLNEVATIGKIHHVHVVRLLGFCIEESHEMLVYEYVANCSLDKWLFPRIGRGQISCRVLLWEERYGIAIGIARGLNYLHEECRHRIVHCDIKPQNILLDEQMRPKIADFGLARLMGREESRVTTLARGTPGYMGPEFWMGGDSQLSTKFDVYSYGMVLLELISGQRNFGHGVCFPERAHEAATRGNFEAILDAQILGIVASTSFDGEECIIEDGIIMAPLRQRRCQVRTALLVALWCIQDHPANRPTMDDVVKYLEGIASINERPPRPTIASFIISNSAHDQQPLSVSNGAQSYVVDVSPVSFGGR